MPRRISDTVTPSAAGNRPESYGPVPHPSTTEQLLSHRIRRIQKPHLDPSRATARKPSPSSPPSASPSSTAAGSKSAGTFTTTLCDDTSVQQITTGSGFMRIMRATRFCDECQSRLQP